MLVKSIKRKIYEYCIRCRYKLPNCSCKEDEDGNIVYTIHY